MDKISKETEEKIAQLQMLEQNIQALIMQRQQFRAQIMEVENAIKEVSNAKGATYKIVGAVMVETAKESLEKDLTAKKEILEMRIKNIQKQEDALKEKAEKLQSEVMNEISKKQE